MMWRLLMRRCPTRSMTLVGDVAQVGLGGRRVVLGARSSTPTCRAAGGLEELTVNYRTPAQVMRLASDVLAAAGIVGADARVGPRGRLDSRSRSGCRRGRPGGRRATPCAPSSSCSARAGSPSSRRPRRRRRAARRADRRAARRARSATGSGHAGPAGLGARRRSTSRAWSSTSWSLVEPADDPGRLGPRRQRPLRRADPADPAAPWSCTPATCPPAWTARFLTGTGLGRAEGSGAQPAGQAGGGRPGLAQLGPGVAVDVAQQAVDVRGEGAVHGPLVLPHAGPPGAAGRPAGAGPPRRRPGRRAAAGPAGRPQHLRADQPP